MAVRVSVEVVLTAEEAKYADAWRDRGQPHPTSNICVLLGRHKVRTNGAAITFSYAAGAEFGPCDAQALVAILDDTKSAETRARVVTRLRDWLDQSIIEVIGALDGEEIGQPKEPERHFIGRVPVSARRPIMLAQQPLHVATTRFSPVWLQKGNRWEPAPPTGVKPILFTRAAAVARAERLQDESRVDFYFVVEIEGMAIHDRIVWPTPGIVAEIGRL